MVSWDLFSRACFQMGGAQPSLNILKIELTGLSYIWKDNEKNGWHHMTPSYMSALVNHLLISLGIYCMIWLIFAGFWEIFCWSATPKHKPYQAKIYLSVDWWPILWQGRSLPCWHQRLCTKGCGGLCCGDWSAYLFLYSIAHNGIYGRDFISAVSTYSYVRNGRSIQASIFSSWRRSLQFILAKRDGFRM